MQKCRTPRKPRCGLGCSAVGVSEAALRRWAGTLQCPVCIGTVYEMATTADDTVSIQCQLLPAASCHAPARCILAFWLPRLFNRLHVCSSHRQSDVWLLFCSFALFVCSTPQKFSVGSSRTLFSPIAFTSPLLRRPCPVCLLRPSLC